MTTTIAEALEKTRENLIRTLKTVRIYLEIKKLRDH
jgi:hypothetical protein